MPVPSVAEFMTAHPHTVRRNQNVETARRLMQQYRIRHLPVIEGGRVVGIVSQRDVQLFGTSDGQDPRHVPVGEVMTREIASVPPWTPLGAVAQQMETSRTGSVLVESEGELIGIFTTTDALRALRRMTEISGAGGS